MKRNNEYPATSSSTAELTQNQIDRLRSVLSEKVEIHGRGNFPTISTPLISIVKHLKHRLCLAGVSPLHVKVNGGAASYVVSQHDFTFSDLDLIFDMKSSTQGSFDQVRSAVFATIADLMPGTANKAKIDVDILKDVYMRKMVKVCNDDDRWSLFSLNNDFGRCIELKFVERMKRQFEFSVDSFQITLDTLIDHFDDLKAVPVNVESKYGDIRQALTHLHERLIDTRRPEEIRGGGLLKYCHLLLRGYRAAHPNKCCQLEKYMCSRFFIDFPDVSAQEQKLRNYLDNHFGSHDPNKYDFLMLLHRIIQESTVCLMVLDRRMTLGMIDQLAFQVSLNALGGPAMEGHTPKSTLVYLPRNTCQWIAVPVV
ncbi:unnamed protein product [Auanema sp. JU1783]|nr:unnamed protein product [Auanema sp. JU1783]